MSNLTKQSTPPILIIGAGIAGLTLAQACRKYELPFRIFERDASATHRSAGWGLTLNWGLQSFRSLLPEDILNLLPEAYVNKEAVDAGEKGSFTFFNLSTGEAKWKVPATERIRVSRERLRKLMLRGLTVEWEKRLVDVKREREGGGVIAVFEDGIEVNGSLLVGCDGANSQVRRLCHPKTYQNERLPIRFLGAGVQYSEAEIAEIRKLDPFFLQGSDPRSDVFLWFSFLNTPTDPNSGEGQEGKYYVQVMTSWPYRSGFLGRSEPSEMPETKEEQLKWMKTLSNEWVEPFKSIVQRIPIESEIMAIHLADWLPRSTTAPKGLEGRVVLVGDAAHTMVMYRGEGANHSIVDVAALLEHIRPLFQTADGEVHYNDMRWQEALTKYEAEMIERSEMGVLASRQACLDAHDFRKLDDRSPLVRRRLMRADLEERN